MKKEIKTTIIIVVAILLITTSLIIFETSKVNAIKIEKDLSALPLNELKAFLAYKVKSLYKLMIVQSEAVEVRKKDLESKKAYYEQAKALVEQGLKTKADASRFLYAVYNARDDLAIAKSGYEKAKSLLATKLSLSDIALKLSYSEAGNFSHAFKRWSGGLLWLGRICRYCCRKRKNISLITLITPIFARFFAVNRAI